MQHTSLAWRGQALLPHSRLVQLRKSSRPPAMAARPLHFLSLEWIRFAW